MKVKTTKPPGRRVIKQMSLHTKWLILAPISLTIIGLGVCLVSEAAHLKHTGAPFFKWFAMGTYSLVILNAGIALFGQAVIFKVKMEYRREMRRETQRIEKDLKAAIRRRLGVNKTEETESLVPSLLQKNED
jgi:hypothetical protein